MPTLNWIGKEAVVNQSVMNAMTETQEMARLFSEDEAVWRAFEHKRALRRLLGSRTPFSEHVLDYLDLLEAEREGREVRAIGFFLPVPRSRSQFATLNSFISHTTP